MNRTDEQAPASEPARKGLGRRAFFAAGGVAAAGVVLAACGDDDDDTDAGQTTTTDGGQTTTTDGEETTTTGGGGGGDAEIAAFAAGLELLAANTYGAAIEAVQAGELGEVPPAVVEYATTAQAHHQAYSDALAEAAGGVTPEVPADIEAAVMEQFGEVSDVVSLATFARDFERQAADTYLDVIPKLESEAAIDLAGSILPVTRQRIAILNFALGEYPIPETFATADRSLAPG